MPPRLAAVRGEAAGPFRGLLALGSGGRSRRMTAATDTAPTLVVRDLKKHYPVRRGFLSRVVGQAHAVDGVSFEGGPGETLGLVGESGCGKSTIGKTVMKLVRATSGSIVLRGRDITGVRKAALRPRRRGMQMIFQDPYSSLNPRMSAGEIVAEP